MKHPRFFFYFLLTIIASMYSPAVYPHEPISAQIPSGSPFEDSAAHQALVLKEKGEIRVEIVKNDSGFKLIRGGEPYYIKGAGGSQRLQTLVLSGGNSIRTWGTENAQAILDSAQHYGLTVCMGLWVTPERQGFNYNDATAIQRQRDRFRKSILKLKDHPALLCWGVGNEVNLKYKNKKVWRAVNDIAKMIHELDPNHPTVTITAGISAELVGEIQSQCPEIDILGVNVYGDAEALPQKLKSYGWKKPYLVGEFGPNGHWEVSKTKWGAAIEPSSMEKAIDYQKRYTTFLQDRASCLGSYVFVWGQKQERTPTWYGIFLESGEATQVLDLMTKAWSGNEPKNRAPEMSSFLLDGKGTKSNIMLKKMSQYTATVKATDIDGDSLTTRWEILAESTEQKDGGDAENKPETFKSLIRTQTEAQLSFDAPNKSGAYRLFVVIYDNKGKACTANIPFFVDP
jgi:hypothetical protein